jgi:general secretion pathway protein E
MIKAFDMESSALDVEAFEQSLGRRLIESGKLSEAGLNRAFRLRSTENGRLPVLLPSLGLVSEHDLALAMAEEFGAPIVTEADLPSEPLFVDRLGARFLRQMRVLPLEDRADGLVLAIANPLDQFAIDAVRMAVGRNLILRIAEPGLLEKAYDLLYEPTVTPGTEDSAIAEDRSGLEFDVERLKDMASEAPVVRLVNNLIMSAVDRQASDIHIEPSESGLRVRYRIDGVLTEVEAPPVRMAPAVVSRIKIMGKLNIAERRLPQDGRAQVVARGKTIDLRVATMPGLEGESVVLRILDRQSVVLELAALGVTGADLEQVERMLARPNGILLVTGPTGSGKTTTLYAILKRLNSPEKKILTVEDPIEYRLEGSNQVQVKPGIGLNFATVLRSMLRHDPDIIMVGEIRDGETAEIAVQAALTGHLVLSTLHTNDAASSVTRLLDMGVEDYLLTSTLTGVIAQRLVRRLCPHCRIREKVLPEVAEEVGFKRLKPEGEIFLYRPGGCAKCNNGYAGRTAIVEILAMTDNLRQAVMRAGDARALQKVAKEDGLTTMFENGLRMVLEGATSLEEVVRVTRES